MNEASPIERLGYQCIGFDGALARWVQSAAAVASDVLRDEAFTHWYRHRGTWFVGVDALPNDSEGRIAAGPPMQGEAVTVIASHFGFQGPWHRGQLSVCYPGYPLRDEGETDGQHRFRLTRDAAHVDGLHGEGPGKRRHLRELHRFILGIPLNETPQDAAPFVIWEKSHLIMQAMFRAALGLVPVEDWGDVDLTEPYAQARRQAFESCTRRVLHARPGEAYVIHPMALHGVAPWPGLCAAPGGKRMIVYFRPETDIKVSWLNGQ